MLRTISGRLSLVMTHALAIMAIFVSGCGDHDEHRFHWLLLADDPLPIASSSRTVAYDESRDRLVVCSSNLDGSTWEFDGNRWTEFYPDPAPLIGWAAAACYHPGLKAVVIFGGVSSGYLFSQALWMWDGRIWTDITPADSPPPRYGAGLVYDSDRRCLVLFGGSNYDTNIDYNDTWVWNDGVWSELHPAHAPSGRYDHGMVYDPVAHRTVLYGGIRFPNTFQDTWAFDGADWTMLESTVTPGNRRQPAMMFDRLTGYPVLSGGYPSWDDYLVSHDYWELVGSEWRMVTDFPGNLRLRNPSLWQDRTGSIMMFCHTDYVFFGGYSVVYRLEGTTLTEIEPPPGPQPQMPAAAAYDEANNRLICYSPYDRGRPRNITWSYAGGAWQELGTTALPHPSDYEQYEAFFLTYDVRRGIVLRIPSQIISPPHTFTWFELEGTTWNQHEFSGGPRMKRNPAHAYDRDRGILILFGGDYGDYLWQQPGSETWEFDGIQWREIHPEQAPTPRSSAAMVYDELHRRIILFGGLDETLYVPFFRDTWEYNGVTWRRVMTEHAPSTAGSMVYDRSSQQVLMTVGRNESGPASLELWCYDGADWRLVQTHESVNSRLAMSLVYDSQHQTIVLFGGSPSGTTASALDYHGFYADLWELRR